VPKVLSLAKKGRELRKVTTMSKLVSIVLSGGSTKQSTAAASSQAEGRHGCIDGGGGGGGISSWIGKLLYPLLTSNNSGNNDACLQQNKKRKQHPNDENDNSVYNKFNHTSNSNSGGICSSPPPSRRRHNSQRQKLSGRANTNNKRQQRRTGRKKTRESSSTSSTATTKSSSQFGNNNSGSVKQNATQKAARPTKTTIQHNNNDTNNSSAYYYYLGLQCGLKPKEASVIQFVADTPPDHQMLIHTSEELRNILSFHNDEITEEDEIKATNSYRCKMTECAKKKKVVYNGGRMATSDSKGVGYLHYSPMEAKDNIDDSDKNHRMPLEGDGSECILLELKSFPFSCVRKTAESIDPDFEWGEEHDMTLSVLGNGLTFLDNFPFNVEKPPTSKKGFPINSEKWLRQKKEEICNTLGLPRVELSNGEVIEPIDFAHLLSTTMLLRQIVVIHKTTGNKVPLLAIGKKSSTFFVNGGHFSSDLVLGCGKGDHPSSMTSCSNTNMNNVTESDLCRRDFYSLILGREMTFSFGLDYLLGNFSEEELEIINEAKRFACSKGGRTTGDIRARAALFVYEQVTMEGLSKEEALIALSETLGSEYLSIYEGSIKGGKKGGKTTANKRARAALFVAKEKCGGNHDLDDIYTKMANDPELGEEYVSLHRGSTEIASTNKKDNKWREYKPILENYAVEQKNWITFEDAGKCHQVLLIYKNKLEPKVYEYARGLVKVPENRRVGDVRWKEITKMGFNWEYHDAAMVLTKGRDDVADREKRYSEELDSFLGAANRQM
jgi:hypothetical protein